MTGSQDLIDPSGKPLIKEPKLIVIKTPKDSPMPKQLIMEISKVTKCIVVSIPMDSELMMGNVAMKELDSVHSAIHAIKESPGVHFSAQELNIIYKSLCFLCEKTQPPDSAEEIRLMKELKEYLKEK